MRYTNIVFWFLVIIGLAALWALLSGCFHSLGEWLSDAFNEIKENTIDENEEE